jgi:nucleoside-diphosphate-sugar epimerase
VKYIILGAGYSLLPLTSRLEAGSTVITVNTPEKLNVLKRQGIKVKLLNLADQVAVQDFFASNPDAEILIDGVPPIKSSAGPATSGVQNVISYLPLLSSLKKIFYLSSTGVYGVRDGSWVDEKSPARPIEEKAKARLKCELMYQDTPYEVTCFRISGIYGPQRGPGKNSAESKMKLVKDRWSNRIHVEDLREIIVRSIKHKGSLPPILNVSDNQPTPAKEVFEFFASKFEVGPFDYITFQEALSLGLTSHMQNQRVCNKLLLESLNLELIYPSYKEGAFACNLALK